MNTMGTKRKDAPEPEVVDTADTTEEEEEEEQEEEEGEWKASNEAEELENKAEAE